MIVTRWLLWLYERSVALSPTRKTLTQQQTIERKLGGPQSKALITLYKLVFCCFFIFLLEEFSWDPLKIDSFAINNANAPYTTKNQPFSNPRAPFESFFMQYNRVNCRFGILNKKKIIGINWKSTVSPSTTRMPLTQQQTNRSAIQGHHSKALATHYDRVYCRFGIFILKEEQ